MKNQITSVLVVEDDALDRLNMKRQLAKSNLELEIYYAEDYQSALEASRHKEFDCIFLDYNLPGATGLEVLRAIRNCGNNSPVIFITSHKEMNVAVEAMKSGALDFLSKDGLTSESLSQNIRYALRIGKIERELEENKRNLRTVISNSPIVLFSINHEGYFTLFDGKGSMSLMVDPKLVLNSHISDFSDILPDIEMIFNLGIEGKSDRVIKQMGDQVFEMYYAPIFGEEQDIIGVTGMATDVTALQKAKEAAEEAACLKQQFLANMSHEIRTPMNGIMGLTKILMNTMTTEEQQGYLHSIKSCSEHLMVIINDILDFSKVEAGKMTFESVPFSIGEVARESVALFNMKAAEKSIGLELNIDPLLPIAVSGDPTRLSQVINNLISNAIKFTDQGKVELIIKPERIASSSTDIVFEVRDTGIGIREESVPFVFESFRQASSDTTRKYGGTGLGLSIVKKLIDLQDGRIEADSKYGEGTTFRFRLTFDRTDEKLLKNKEKDLSIDYSIEGKRVLLAEDNLVNQVIAKKMLKDWGAMVTAVENGEEAISILQHETFDIVLMDIQMPEMDGYTATKMIRRELNDTVKNIPIVAMTAHATSCEKDKCFTSGMDDYICKPFEPEALKKIIYTLTLNGPSSYGALSEIKREIDTTERSLNEITATSNTTNSAQSINNMATPSNLQESIKQEFVHHKINLNYLKQISDGNDGFIIEMIEMFLNKTPQALEEMNEHFKSQNWNELRMIAHRIRPSFTYIGLPDLQKKLGEIERLTSSPENVSPEVSSLIYEVDLVSKSAFRQLKAELSHLK